MKAASNASRCLSLRAVARILNREWRSSLMQAGRFFRCRVIAESLLSNFRSGFGSWKILAGRCCLILSPSCWEVRPTYVHSQWHVKWSITSLFIVVGRASFTTPEKAFRVVKNVLSCTLRNDSWTVRFISRRKPPPALPFQGRVRVTVLGLEALDSSSSDSGGLAGGVCLNLSIVLLVSCLTIRKG